MRNTEVVIVGGGLAGSLVAAMLGNVDIDVVLVDPHPVYPEDFRCEKLDGPQVEILRKTGVADAVLRATTPDGEAWVARFGRVVDKRPSDQRGISYTPLVNTVRIAWTGAAFLPAPVLMLVELAAKNIEPRDARQDSDEPGSTAAATLEINTFGLGVEGRLQAPPFAMLVGAELLRLEGVTRLHRRLLGFERPAALGLAALQGVL